VKNCRVEQCFAALFGLCLLAMLPLTVIAGDGHERSHADIRFTDIATRPDSGIHYHRTRSKNDALWDKLRSKPVVTLMDFGSGAPVRSRGTPGVAVLDYDRDGDLDIFVTNGPGSPNSLFSSQLMETGELKFVDVAKAAGVDSPDLDSTGVCYGDIDNDGDYDLFVVSAGGGSKLFVNNGDKTFSDVSVPSLVDGRQPYSVGCSMGDVNGDGLLDIVIANTTQSWDYPASPTVHNQLLLNKGNHVFEDVSEESGITKLTGFALDQANAAGLTWGVAMVDYDQDGDMDIILAQDQAVYIVGGTGGVPGMVHIFQNDGTGHFKDVGMEAGTNIPGAWMGLAFGDINSDGIMDMFVTNMGDYINSEYFPYKLGDLATRWFLGQPDHTFVKEEVSGSNATAFGWGTVMSDVDNDGDTDIVFLGGMDGGPLVDASNPGLILMNDGNGNMTLDKRPLHRDAHRHRDVQGLAQGDFNNDGFIDLVSVSDFDIPDTVPLQRYTAQYGSVLDDTAFFAPTFTQLAPGQFTWAGYEMTDGSLAIDMNNAASRNGSVKVDLMGTVGMVKGGQSNRDGVGAIVRFTPRHGKTAMHPVTAGDSYASQSALTAHFGLGKAKKGTVDVMWTGGTRNRLYGVREGETVLIPEIPCSYTSQWSGMNAYRRCVTGALRELKRKNAVTDDMRHRLYDSAMRAYVSNLEGTDSSAGEGEDKGEQP